MIEYADCQDGVTGGEWKLSTCHSAFGTNFQFNQPHPAMHVEATSSQQVQKEYGRIRCISRSEVIKLSTFSVHHFDVSLPHTHLAGPCPIPVSHYWDPFERSQRALRLRSWAEQCDQKDNDSHQSAPRQGWAALKNIPTLGSFGSSSTQAQSWFQVHNATWRVKAVGSMLCGCLWYYLGNPHNSPWCWIIC